jgi:hypothetical protein
VSGSAPASNPGVTSDANNNHNYVPVMNKYLKLIYNVLQFVLWNYPRCHYLEPLKKGVITKMAYLVELCLILESDLVERSPHRIFVEWI